MSKRFSINDIGKDVLLPAVHGWPEETGTLDDVFDSDGHGQFVKVHVDPLDMKDDGIRVVSSELALLC